MNKHHWVNALALFGSCSRREQDAYSDRDLLIIYDENHQEKRAILRNSFERSGYSPSLYSWDDLEQLGAQGSLFVQHLKQESQLLYDREGRLRGLLDSFRPIQDYGAKIDENRLLFRLTSGVPDALPALGWALDVLAVAFRNHAILHFAQRKQYIFSFNRLVDNIAQEFSLADSDILLLKGLRAQKHRYRRHPATVQVGISQVWQTQALLEKLTRVQFASPSLPAHKFVEGLLATAQQERHWYHALRCYEGAYRALGYSPAHDQTRASSEIEALFANPSPYTVRGASSLDLLRQEFRCLHTSRGITPVLPFHCKVSA